MPAETPSISVHRDQLSTYLNQIFEAQKANLPQPNTSEDTKTNTRSARGGEGVRRKKKKKKSTPVDNSAEVALNATYLAISNVIDSWADKHFGERVPRGQVASEDVYQLCREINGVLLDTEFLVNKTILKDREKFRDFLEKYDADKFLGHLWDTGLLHINPKDQKEIDPQTIVAVGSKHKMPLGVKGRDLIPTTAIKKLAEAHAHLLSSEAQSAAQKAKLNGADVYAILTDVYRGRQDVLVMMA